MNQNPKRPQDDPKSKQAQVQGDNPEEEEDDEEEVIGQRFLFFNAIPSWAVSFLTHVAAIILLALIVMPGIQDPTVSFNAGESVSVSEDSAEMDFNPMDFETEPLETEVTEETPTEVVEQEEITLPEAMVELGAVLGADEPMDVEEFGKMPSPTNETSSRTGQGRAEGLRRNGGSSGSEKSVELALKWIIDHQLPDGGWNLDHQRGPGKHRTSPNPGSATEARSGATALALLPLLAHGDTHKTGKYKKQVQAGLRYLMKRAKRSGNGISYWEPQGTMYSHGLVAIVFCEAYAMTKDKALLPYAQGTIAFTEQAQDPVGGGWRYQPKQAGDTSAVGWQLMALKSAKISGLHLNPKTYKRTEKFLDSVSIDYGAFYGYANKPQRKQAGALTAVGLLCRMYMGWSKDHPGLTKGVDAISKRGPDTSKTNDMYYNYYATQVMFHMGGRTWKEWNAKMRDHLVKTQAKQGDAAGSWKPGNTHGGHRGGRLYTTSLSCMTLEIYYRYLPIFGNKATSDEFMLVE